MRKSPVAHTVSSIFSITGKDLAAQLADFCALKKLAWSPDVKIAMAKTPASSIADAAWSKLNDVPVSELQSILATLLAPVKQHQLFDLADWMRDLNSGQVPDYLQTHWSNHRVPAGLDQLVMAALDVGANSAEDAGDEEGDSDELADGWVDEKPRTKRKSVARKLTGPKGRGKVAKQDMRPVASGEADAMNRIASSKEDLVGFLSKGYVKPKVKMELYTDIAHRSLTAYGVKGIEAKQTLRKGVPVITIGYKSLTVDQRDFLEAELKEVFKNKAHVNVDVAQTEIVLRVRKDAPKVEKAVRKQPKRANAKRATTKRVSSKRVTVKKAPRKQARMPATPAANDAPQTQLPFPTSESMAAKAKETAST